jgi:glycosyltransferase involved in cell wall biosynthesis
MAEKRRRIVYLTCRDAKDKRAWSGTLYNMAQSLSKHAGEVIYVGPYEPKYTVFCLKVGRAFLQFLFKKRYNIFHSYIISLAYKWHFNRKINKLNPDIVFAAASTPESSLLKVNCPIILLNDITFELLKDGYGFFSNLLEFSIAESNYIDKRAMTNASAIVFSSEWAANSAINFYKIPEHKIHVISYGANMDNIPDYNEAIQKTKNGLIKILFLGVDWERKGGDIVYDTFIELINRGCNVQLTICGCVPPERCNHENLKVTPFLNKNKPEDLKVLHNILLDTNFLFVPSKADCTPIAFCEANAFGIPVITSNVGGITSVIKSGINGHTMPIETTIGEYANIIEEYNKPDKYANMVVSSRNYYDSNLNWDQWGKAMDSLMDSLQKK